VIERKIVPAIALCIVAIVAAACGSFANTPAAPDTEAVPTAAIEPPSDAPQPGGPSGPPAGLGRNSRFVPLDNPEVVSADEATFLQPDDRVLGLTVGGESRAYPISMMTFHHVANDELGGLPVLVTF